MQLTKGFDRCDALFEGAACPIASRRPVSVVERVEHFGNASHAPKVACAFAGVQRA